MFNPFLPAHFNNLQFFLNAKSIQEVSTVKLLTPKEVAERLSVSSLTVIRLADAGALPVVEVTKQRHRRTRRFRPEAVEKFIASRETATSK